METPSMPGGADRVKQGASRTKDNAGTATGKTTGRTASKTAGRAAGKAGTAAGAAGGAARRAGAGVQQVAGQVAGTAVALPGQVAKLGRLLTLRRLLRAVPAVAVAGAAVVVARRLARKR